MEEKNDEKLSPRETQVWRRGEFAPGKLVSAEFFFENFFAVWKNYLTAP
ncbi:MAG: hypothetical protein LBJ64_05765 [Deltaproteobacteria bacterium]|jgi:hypothetical protein|nr:hypothetical protein [Deltaproteobacteria bacterium]